MLALIKESEIVNQIFRSLVEEGQFTREILGSGVTQIGKANYAKKGIYFQSFTSLSTGLERIGKLCLFIEYYIKHNGVFPDDNFIKNEIGHDLVKLYLKSEDIVRAYNTNFEFLNNLRDPLHQTILIILSKFAKGDRYSNIDFLVGSSNKSDPIFEWNRKVDKVLFETRVSKKKKEKIRTNAKIIDKYLNPFSLVHHSSESRKEIYDIESASFLTGMNESIIKYRQLYLLQIIRYWVELLKDLQYRAMELQRNEIPYFLELFAIFYNHDSYFLTRKTFETN
ncbi:MAG: hypothetical protein HQ510_03065 [Candidatus Marinimicrobia bacterium]|nr:hypothetical protein [Candidatus Neomarinimicrobiota bacterium]